MERVEDPVGNEEVKYLYYCIMNGACKLGWQFLQASWLKRV